MYVKVVVGASRTSRKAQSFIYFSLELFYCRNSISGDVRIMLL